MTFSPKTWLSRLALSLVVAPMAFANVAFAQDNVLGRPVPGGWKMQDAATPVMDKVHEVHNLVNYIIFGIVILVTVLMVYILIRFREKANPVPSKTSHNTLLEIVWTILPVVLLLIMVVPSMQLLYLQDDLPETEMTVKAVGDTWYWSYQYPDHEAVEGFDSYPLSDVQAKEMDEPYLLATDAPLVVPVNTKVKVLVTSNNNMHSFAMPSFGIKMDAVPGIINETWFEVYEEGTYYGQCSEICGILHYKMPIEIKVVSQSDFASWVAAGGPSEKADALARIKTASNTSTASGTTVAAQK